MIYTQEELIENALLYFKRKDFSLGYRTLLDAALNTDSEKIFVKVLDFVEKYENESKDDKSSLLSLFEECCIAVKSIKIESENLMGKTILKGQNITKIYNKGRFTLGPVNVELKKGDIFGLVGENGNGKTTLLKCASFLLKPDGGQVKLDNKTYALTKDKITELYPKIGVMSQEFLLWPHLTNRKNIELPLKENDIKFDYKKLADNLNVIDILDKFPNDCSGGEKQRVSLLRQLSLGSEYLFLDEITSALDVEHIKIVEDILLDLKKNNVSIFLITHSINLAKRLGDEFIFLDKGEVIERGEISKLEDPETQRLKSFLTYNF